MRFAWVDRSTVPLKRDTASNRSYLSFLSPGYLFELCVWRKKDQLSSEMSMILSTALRLLEKTLMGSQRKLNGLGCRWSKMIATIGYSAQDSDHHQHSREYVDQRWNRTWRNCWCNSRTPLMMPMTYCTSSGTKFCDGPESRRPAYRAGAYW